MARKALEMTIEIGGRVAGSLGNVFRRANGDIDDLRNRSRSAQRELNRLGNEFRQGRITQTQYAEATARITREMQRLENAQRRIKAMSGALNNGINTGKAVAGAAAIGTAFAATATAISSLNTAADFEAQMAKVQSKTSATKEEMTALNQEALRLGASTSLSASQVAVAMNELGAKGFDASKIISAMPGVIAAAESSGEDLALTADVTTSALNAFNLEGSKASKVADIMAMTANKTAAGIGDIGYAFKYAAPWANALGISIEELSAATGMMVDKGLAGEQAGTSLRMGLNRLAQEPEKAGEALKELGVSAFDAEGKFTSMNQLVNDLRKSLTGLSQKEKLTAIGSIFGADASSGWLTLIDSAPGKLETLTKALEESEGVAQKAADKMKDNFAGAKEQMFGALESAQIALATPSLDVLKDTFQGLTGMVEDGMPAIEKVGEKIAGGLRDILEPFATLKPELTPEIRHDPEAFKEYEKALAKFDHFDGMDFGDKVIYMLDTASGKMEEWLGGSGGEAMGRIFTKLGEIAFNAWLAAFTGSLKASGSNLMEGNIGGAVGMGAAAWMLGGGAMVKGAFGAGRWAVDAYKGRTTATATSTPTSTTPTTGQSQTARTTPNPMIGPSQTGTITSRNATGAPTPMIGPSATGTITPRTPAAPPPAVTATATTTATTATRTVGSLGKTALSAMGKVASKAMLPLTLASEAFNIYKSNDKAKATGEAAGGLAGTLGGAKLGAVIGTAVGGPIGTAIGGVLGGAVGYFGGKWAGGKAVDTVRGESPTATATSNPMPTASAATATTNQTVDVSQLNSSAATLATTLNTANTHITVLASSTALSATNMSLLASYAGQASGMLYGSFFPLQTNANLTAMNMSLLTSYTGQASGMVYGSFFSLKTNTDLVVNNMSLLVSYVGQASGWISSLQSIQPAAQRVVTALNTLESRINSIQLPGGATSRRTAYE